MTQGSSLEEDRDSSEDFQGQAKGLLGVGKVSGQGLDDTVGAHREFSRTSLKVSGKSLGTHREIAGGRP
ncbi:hypothetical protein GW17_00057124 [Ensete ventricosum]|nr:hypothetical protein GW17_00057124 [Ensete ventricosum]